MENTEKKQSKLIMVFGFFILLVMTVLAFFLFITVGIAFLGWLIMILLLICFGFIIFKMFTKGIKFIGIMAGIFTILILSVFIFTGGTGANRSSVVSVGVDKSDLGNIINGQYYFDDGDFVYYSTFDNQFRAHIYQVDKKNNETISIFDGFGWSLVEHKGYLYFSGNAGTAIDGTYNLYKMNLEDFSYEIINNQYCYNMSLYNDWLYFINKDASGDYSYQRIHSESEKRDVIVQDGSGKNIVVHNKKLYYQDGSGYIVRAELNGNNGENILDHSIDFFIIGNGKIIYIQDNKIKSCDLDGGNINTIREADDKGITSINSDGNTIYFSYYFTDKYDDVRNAYPYGTSSIKIDGKNEKQVYESSSWGIYVNIIDGKVYFLDYINNVEAGHKTYVTVISMVDGKVQSLLLPK